MVQHTGPLGTCMDYIQEDLSLMSSELHRWEEECKKLIFKNISKSTQFIILMVVMLRRYEAEIEIQKQKTQDTLKPFYSELNELEEQVSVI